MMGHGMDDVEATNHTDPQTGFGREPVHKYNGKWWFWDEVWAHRMGKLMGDEEVGFNTEEEAHKALDAYVEYLNSTDNGEWRGGR